MSVASQASLNQSLAGRSLTSYFTGSTQLASFSENRTLRLESVKMLCDPAHHKPSCVELHILVIKEAAKNCLD